MLPNILLVLHEENSSVGSTLEWCAHRGLSPHVQVASQLSRLPASVGKLPAIFFGGDMEVWDETKCPWLVIEKRFLAMRLGLNLPNFGLCLGAQLIAEQLGAVITPSDEWQVGWFPVTHEGAELTPLHWHSSSFSLPPGARQTATDANGRNQGFELEARQMGFQFHGEIDSVRLAHVVSNWKPTLIGEVQDRIKIEHEAERLMPMLKEWYFRQLDRWRVNWI